MRPGDSLLLGADQIKDRLVLHAAYNDAAGLTAAFNLNVLRVLNRELDAGFDVQAFDHEASYNESEHQVEMYLVANRRHTVPLRALSEQLLIDTGERILTEISRKFTPEDLGNLLGEAGFNAAAHYEPGNAYFSLVLAHPS
jgi:L-histidine N-alpha-methyltransferase